MAVFRLLNGYKLTKCAYEEYYLIKRRFVHFRKLVRLRKSKFLRFEQKLLLLKCVIK